MPLVHSQRMFCWEKRPGQGDFLAIALLAALGADRQAVVGQLQLHVLLADAGDLGQHQDVVFLLVDVDQRLADVLDHGLAGGLAADVAEGLDLDFLLALVAQGGLDGEAVDAAELALGVEALELAGLARGSGRFRPGRPAFPSALPSFPSKPPRLKPTSRAAFVAAGVVGPGGAGSVFLHFGHRCILSAGLSCGMTAVASLALVNCRNCTYCSQGLCGADGRPAPAAGRQVVRRLRLLLRRLPPPGQAHLPGLVHRATSRRI